MSDGTFCDYSGHMDSAVLQQLAGYSGRSGAENLGKYCFFRSAHSNLCPSNVAIYTVTTTAII